MSINIHLIEGPLKTREANLIPDCGAVLSFTGWVRPLEEGQALLALNYEIYEPMTQRSLEKLCNQYIEQYPLKMIEVRHSYGRVPVNKCSFELLMASPHRQATLVAMNKWIDEMKKIIPIWKVPEYDHSHRRY